MVDVKVAWYWHELKSHIYGLREMDRYGTTEKEMKKVNYQEMVCDVYVYVINLYCVVWYDWSVSVRNSLEISRWDFRVALQWSGRNSMAPVSGCPWWCPICITR